MTLLQPARELERYSLLAVDGAIGNIERFYFDDSTWTIRYLVVNTGSWLMGRRVLISPVATGEIDDKERSIDIELTREQIENSPPISADNTVSRQYEEAYYRYYNWTPYWEFGAMSGFPMTGTPLAPPPVPRDTVKPGAQLAHLRSTARVNGYSISALDGEIGHVEDVIVDTRYWVIRYLEIDTRNWWPGKHILLNPVWIEDVNWTEQTVSVALTREAIKRAPAYDPSKPISRNYETKLFRHYGRPVYWCSDNEES